ncbi:hypothetical protein [Cyanobacterium aponinum]|uniref:Uncharacterized protein n=1 Tax=Cyanobacterium aponinum (strain PCC 10605) TaxID=755178 RepID=K9Z7P0_CYAAP|nr:hypothetical protein [Cyanobacterium aponinum]AFZ54737.1 hypothetical protein Cyan10605_2663 [Cyanobacterium aponinum PCC 10605]
MNENQLSIFDTNVVNDIKQINETLPSYIPQISYDLDSYTEAILISALASQSIIDSDNYLLSFLASNPKTKIILSSFNSPQLTRKLKKSKQQKQVEKPSLENKNNQVFYDNQQIGEIKLLYKPSIPGELQAKLAYLSTIDRFLEYLQTHYYSINLGETDYHIHIFIPAKYRLNIEQEWVKFVKKVLFSIEDKDNDKLPRLPQTFISMLKSITLAGRGFSTINVPIITQDQGIILASLYLAVFQQVKQRQDDRESLIKQLKKELNIDSLSEKERNSKEKELQKKEEMQKKEYKKYCEGFEKTFIKILTEHKSLFDEQDKINLQLQDASLNKRQINKLKKEKEKVGAKIIFSQDFVNQKTKLLENSGGNPFLFIVQDQKENQDKFAIINQLSKSFNRTATEQINSTRGDIFAQCLVEMYRLLENQTFETIPHSLLTEKSIITRVRSPGDDGNKFCYSCGVVLDKPQWRVARFMFERPSQRRQSSSSEDRPYICATCSVLAFASPLKVTDESIIIKLNAKNNNDIFQYKIKDYLRMLANKEMHLNSGHYLILTSDKTTGGDIASNKLGQVQYARAKIADIFPLEVLTDFDFCLVLQGSQQIKLESRHLIFIKGLMEGYAQKIIESGKEINSKLGDAIRYIEQDLPYLADYTLAKVFVNFRKTPNISLKNQILLEKTRKNYYQIMRENFMNSVQLKKQFTLYEDVASLTGLLYPFIQSFKKGAFSKEKPEDAKREVGKLIEKVNDGIIFHNYFCKYSYIKIVGEDEKRSITSVSFKKYPDNEFIYEQVKDLLENTDKLNISGREQKTEDLSTEYLTLYPDDIERAFNFFRQKYSSDKDWKTLTYHLELSIYARFPEQLQKSSKGDN